MALSFDMTSPSCPVNNPSEVNESEVNLCASSTAIPSPLV